MGLLDLLRRKPMSEETNAAVADTDQSETEAAVADDGGPADAPATEPDRKRQIRRNMRANSREASQRRQHDKFSHLQDAEPEAPADDEPAEEAPAQE